MSIPREYDGYSFEVILVPVKPEPKNGMISPDVFPGFFTYDVRKDGYTKTSLLWRLFRYERNPNAGTSVDFLFLPVWR